MNLLVYLLFLIFALQNSNRRALIPFSVNLSLLYWDIIRFCHRLLSWYLVERQQQYYDLFTLHKVLKLDSHLHCHSCWPSLVHFHY